MRTLALSLIFTMFAASCASAQQPPAVEGVAPYAVMDTMFESDGLRIPARILSRPSAAPYPLLVVANGTGSLPRTHEAYQNFYAPYLDAGVAIMLYDDRGAGDTPGEANENAPIPLFARDLLAAIGHARTLAHIDSDRIGVIAYSRGGWVAPLAAQMAPDQIDFLVLISSPAMTRLEQSLVSNTARMEGYSAEEREEIRAFRTVTWHYYATGEGYEEVQRVWAAARQRPWAVRFNLAEAPPAPDALEASRYDFYRDSILDPLPPLRALRVPVLAVFGADDQLVDPVRSADLMRDAFTQSGHPDATIVTVLNAGHNLRRSRDGVESPPGSGDWAAGYPELVVDWLRARTSG